MKVLITGCYGFLGHATVVKFIEEGHEVVGVDKVAEAISVKTERIEDLARYGDKFKFHDLDLAQFGPVRTLMMDEKFDAVVHYAGQYSILHRSPQEVRQYVQGNLIAYSYLAEWARFTNVKRFVYASSTHVGDGRLPVSMYGSTKEFGERCGHVFAELGMPFFALRFSSVYGPRVRTDIGMMQIARKLEKGQPIEVSKRGWDNRYAFVYIDDAAEAAYRAATVEMKEKYEVATVVADDILHDLHDVLAELQRVTGKTGKIKGKPNKRDEARVPQTEINQLRELLGFTPQIKMPEGIERFAEWFSMRNG